eukprot:394061_1
MSVMKQKLGQDFQSVMSVLVKNTPRSVTIQQTNENSVRLSGPNTADIAFSVAQFEGFRNPEIALIPLNGRGSFVMGLKGERIQRLRVKFPGVFASFVNTDSLRIIGCGDDVAKFQEELKKMFAEEWTERSKDKPCHQFGLRGSCRFGANCRFKHDTEAIRNNAQSTSTTQPKSSDPTVMSKTLPRAHALIVWAHRDRLALDSRARLSVDLEANRVRAEGRVEDVRSVVTAIKELLERNSVVVLDESAGLSVSAVSAERARVEKSCGARVVVQGTNVLIVGGAEEMEKAKEMMEEFKIETRERPLGVLAFHITPSHVQRVSAQSGARVRVDHPVEGLGDDVDGSSVFFSGSMDQVDYAEQLLFEVVNAAPDSKALPKDAPEKNTESLDVSTHLDWFVRDLAPSLRGISEQSGTR